MTMKLEDVPTPLCEPFKKVGPTPDTALALYPLLKLTEQKLGLAVAALKEIAGTGDLYIARYAAKETLAQIEKP